MAQFVRAFPRASLRTRERRVARAEAIKRLVQAQGTTSAVTELGRTLFGWDELGSGDSDGGGDGGADDSCDSDGADGAGGGDGGGGGSGDGGGGSDGDSYSR